jgi:pimeloyl-ACP methyl ester carboxylesterase
MHTTSFQLAVYQQGNGEAKNLALVLPGLLDTKDYPNMKAHVDFLASKGFYAISFDPPGTWQSSEDIHEYTMTNYLAAIDELIAQQGNKPTLLVGHSLGGLIATLAAAKSPHVTAFVAIMSPASLVREENGELRAVGRTLEQWEQDGTRPSDRDLPEDSTKTKHFELPFSFAEDAQKYSSLEGLKNLTKPKLFIAGKADTKITPVMVNTTFDAAAEPKQYVEIESDHDYRRSPELIEEVNDVIGQFLEKHKDDSLGNFTEVVRVMANTPPISNKDLKRRKN